MLWWNNFIFTGIICQDLTPVEIEVNSVEGDTVTLSYNFSKTATAGDNFFWYRQDSGKNPEFLLLISGFESSIKTSKLNNRISGYLTGGKDRLDLIISSAEVTDSALYYCAVRPTVTGNTDTLYKNLTRPITGTEPWNNPSTVVVPASTMIYNRNIL